MSKQHLGTINGLWFSKDGKSFFSGGEDGKVCRWNTASSKLLNSYIYSERPSDPSLGIHAIALSPNEGFLAAGGGASGIVVWNLKTNDLCGKIDFIVNDKQYIATSVAFSPDSKFIMATGGNRVHCYELGSDGSIGDGSVMDFGFEDYTYSGTFSPSGHWMVATSDDKTVRIWDVTNKKLHRKFLHPASVHQACFSPDERLILSGCHDGIARLWSLETGDEICRFEGHTDQIEYGVAFSAKGDLIATGSYDKTVKIWKIPSIQKVEANDE